VVAGAVLCQSAHRPAVSRVSPATSRRRRAFAAALLAGSSCIVPSPHIRSTRALQLPARQGVGVRVAWLTRSPFSAGETCGMQRGAAPLRAGFHCSAALWDNAAMCVDAYMRCGTLEPVSRFERKPQRVQVQPRTTTAGINCNIVSQSPSAVFGGTHERSSPGRLLLHVSVKAGHVISHFNSRARPSHPYQTR